MRTSKLSQETTKLFISSSSNVVRRSSRHAAKTISAFALTSSTAHIKSEPDENDVASQNSTANTLVSTDIEDGLLSATPKLLFKRKRGATSQSPRTTPRKRVKSSDSDSDHASVTPRKPKSTPKLPARSTTLADGTTTTLPPSNWAEIYTLIQTMRQANPTAPVDTMGCESLFWASSPPSEQRYHRLVALMLSSQTKDTVTAAAMTRLHTELIPCSPLPRPPQLPSLLTIPNLLAATPAHLNALIAKVGFHNTKTASLQRTARILQTTHSSDVPCSLPALLALPGVGPKMSFLALSACWDIHVGIGVDTHVHRITNLWGWNGRSPTKGAEETRKVLESWLPADKWHEINHLLVGLGQTVCLPVGRRCGECVLQGKGLCKGEVRGWKDGRSLKKVGKKDEDDGPLGVKKEEDRGQVGVKIEQEE